MFNTLENKVNTMTLINKWMQTHRYDRTCFTATLLIKLTLKKDLPKNGESILFSFSVALSWTFLEMTNFQWKSPIANDKVRVFHLCRPSCRHSYNYQYMVLLLPTHTPNSLILEVGKKCLKLKQIYPGMVFVQKNNRKGLFIKKNI